MIEPDRHLIDGIDRTVDVLDFADAIGLNRVAPGRYSRLLLTELFCRTFISKDINPSMVMSEIEHLEDCRKPSNTKEASQFRRPPLAGLWHKHHREIGLNSIGINLLSALKNYGAPQLDAFMQKMERSGDDWSIGSDEFQQSLSEAVHENYRRRKSDSKLTGEWIIFSKNEDKNYYLCLGKHDSGDNVIRQKIESVCVIEYPFLTNTLKA